MACLANTDVVDMPEIEEMSSFNAILAILNH